MNFSWLSYFKEKKKNLQNGLDGLPDFLQIDRLCCLSKDDGKSRRRVFLVEIVHVRKS
jgi:hypothetical protein